MNKTTSTTTKGIRRGKLDANIAKPEVTLTYHQRLNINLHLLISLKTGLRKDLVLKKLEQIHQRQ